MTLINKAALAQCVGRDGGAGTDQFLTDPRDCHFDPKALLCTGGKVPSPFLRRRRSARCSRMVIAIQQDRTPDFAKLMGFVKSST